MMKSTNQKSIPSPAEGPIYQHVYHKLIIDIITYLNDNFSINVSLMRNLGEQNLNLIVTDMLTLVSTLICSSNKVFFIFVEVRVQTERHTTKLTRVCLNAYLL